MSAIPYLQKQLHELTTCPPAGFRIESEDIYVWTVWFTGPQETPYAPGVYRAELRFPKDFPMEPPTFKMLSSIWHPNVYPDGRVCISILHPPGEDEMNKEETAMMRWTPIQTIRSVLLSVVSLFSDPDPKDAGAPANVEALVQYRKNREEFNEHCRRLANKSLSELPEDFVPIPQEEPPERPTNYAASIAMGYDDDYEVVVCDAQNKFPDELRQVREMALAPDKSDAELIDMLIKVKGDVATLMEALM
ncbi:ubiquitin-conjugating enzyme E2, putative [Trypanosoma equiperdum]|uniref:Ubiquitin-conjugating enzyme E2, putative n=4 Tax=Trypanozoon TaxID=39700 RepID=Q382B7_TRYB2|nr:ubiquitin carrier protein, putative [Trypanosoma brucei gambiense DAL972]XP_829476.1 ubiquitin-conjugating enzyme E2, putative [Trypanosoma brucei brucei TREU927]RHW68532.1 ubiquitin-conjugating enzyme E2 [Trypanosoma brucei equiperdum]SCU73087.1 ubiquitin-conjugating enzyme E2, putative [Trypanosoma equiperdum]EAN80364.1 ubiquitin-conjugating enzyme E2, putative [Trypanosoma brucei brucei TREU927]CBH18468.1 ubiquitin carrier protein, putative [Trypanosoma brucei gambiense DAL972]|eukprot:XP_011780732.1 ubiquitin carrier protein, putative [Trypanosoma brucei gambiense DAL972]